MRLAICVLVAACTSPAPPPRAPIANVATPSQGPAGVIATLERQACYGWCPIYTIAIHGDGLVDYHGESFVKVKGAATGRLTQAQLDEVDAAFAAAHYFTLDDKYVHEDASDNPTTITSYRSGSRTKTIEHYHADSRAPAELGKLEEAIDRIVGIERWIGTPEEREAHAREWR